MRSLRGRTSVLLAGLLVAAGGLAAVRSADPVEGLGSASPTVSALPTTLGPRAVRPSAGGDGYAKDVPDRPLGFDPARPAEGTETYGDPDAVLIRVPDRDYGSGYLTNYGRFKRETSPAADFRAAVADPRGCLIIGDSIATFVVRHLVQDLQRTLGATCVYDTWPGRATEGTANALLDLKRRYGLPGRVVVMSGTNDIFNPPLFGPQMERIVDGIGPERQILWVSTFDSRRPLTARSAADERNTAWINSVIEARAARTPNLTIVPWDSLFRDNLTNVDALLTDGVHPNALGVEAMIGLVRRSLAV